MENIKINLNGFDIRGFFSATRLSFSFSLETACDKTTGEVITDLSELAERMEMGERKLVETIGVQINYDYLELLDMDYVSA